MFQPNPSETGHRVISISEPDSRARNLAFNRSLSFGRALPLLPRLQEAAKQLRTASSQIAVRLQSGDSVPAEDLWLVENFRFLETHMRGLQKELKGIAQQDLPLMADGPLFGYPRVFEIASEILAECQGALSIPVIQTFVQEFQSIAPLRMSELWRLDGMLRLALLESLGQAHGAAMRTLVLSLKEISSASWQDFVEANSLSEQILRQDPVEAYSGMDFATRDRYRHAVEEVARRSSVTEEKVAEAAITLARDAVKRIGSESREAHVGYHLIDAGAARLKAGFQYKPTFLGRIRQAILDWPTAFYLIGIEVTTLALAVYLLSFLPEHLSYIGLILFLLATEPAMAFMNALVVYFLPPRQLPKMDFSEGIPAGNRTMIVVPTLLLSEKFVTSLLNDLEVRFLANRDPQLTFALLTDFPDAISSPDGEESLVEFCVSGIRVLNERYASEGRAPFYLLHRRREWNPQQNAWMGWERKRGKLIALNNLLQGEQDAFHIKVGNLSLLSEIRYVITLDSDTELPRGTAHQLVGTLAHPLNRAVIDPETNTVMQGYGILQPRVGISVHSARRSRLAALYSGQTGFDIYTNAISDVYQDLFGEGSYVGKGIYDVQVFQKTLANRFPHNLLLSHDLIEGSYARAGLVSDIEMIDDYPSHYSAWSKRKHRWVRGDWQIMKWLLPRVPDYHGRLVPNPLSIISLWKILDNLRRSLVEIAIFVLLVAGWTFLPGGGLYWTLVVIMVSLLPVYIGTAFSLLRLPIQGPWWLHLRETAAGFVNGHVEVGLRLIFLAHQTSLMLDAIFRSVVRTTVTGARLLEWESAAQAEMGRGIRFRSIDSYLYLAMPLALLAGAVVVFRYPENLPAASPFLIAWLLSPLVALWLNAALYRPKPSLPEKERFFLRGVALRTWQYFADYSTAEENWLIPDNVQEQDTSTLR